MNFVSIPIQFKLLVDGSSGQHFWPPPCQQGGTQVTAKYSHFLDAKGGQEGGQET